ncbi:MAG: metallophosphoesterase [Clostridia bacterium]|nr:metallophosphoesterase [Clostridia bacterium]
MIYVTGDTHGLIDFDKLTRFAGEHKELTRKDYVIICGDFGGVWANETDGILEEYEKLPFTVLFADGNHEDFDQLKEYPVSEWNGGRVQVIRPNVIHLMRGQVFLIEGKKIFVLGGAESTDREYRQPGVNWWPEEYPSHEEIKEAESNLEKESWFVDYVITHSCDYSTMSGLAIPERKKKCISYSLVLSSIDRRLRYSHWYFGHFHVDYNVNTWKTALFSQVVPLGSGVE